MNKKLLLLLLLANFLSYSQTPNVPSYVPTDGLIAYYPFNGNANDQSDNASNGTPTDITLTSDRLGVPNTAYSFNGTSSNIQTYLSNNLQDNNSRTITGWFKATDPVNSKEFDFCVLNYGNTPSSAFKISFYRKGYFDVAFGSQVFSSQEYYFNNEWTFFAMVFDNTNKTFSLYINNVLKITGIANLFTQEFGSYFRIGKNDSNNYFEGSLDDIGVWNRMLTSQEISNLYYSNTAPPSITATIFSGSSTTVCSGQGTSLRVEASPTDNYTYQWKKNGIPIPTKTLPYYRAEASGDYSVEVKNANNSTVTSNTIKVIVNETAPPTSSTPTYILNEGNTVADLKINGSNIKLYYNPNNGSSIPSSTVLTTGKYYATQTINGCESTTRLIVDIIISNTPIKYTLIPDSNFEQKLIDLGIDSGTPDGKVLTSNISSLTSLNVSANNISDLTGIQDFISLTDLYCGQNSLTTLNVSKNKVLTTLDCNNNKIISLDVSNNTALLNLSCYANQLTSLDVKANTALTKLDSGSNKYTSLDVNSNTALTFLGCNTSLLTSIDLSKNTALTLLDCRENKITNLDVSKLTALTELYCQSNQLKDLDVSKNKSLELINCSKNQLTTLDISSHPAAIGLYANSNQLTSLNLKNGNNVNFQLLYLNLTNNPNLSCIQVDDVAYSNTNWSTKKDATASYNTNCFLPYTLIPDINFEKKLIDLGIDSGNPDGKVLTSNVSSLTSLDVSSSLISDLTGIQDFTSLNILNCENNKLLTLDISNNKLLKELNCRYNNLTALELSANINLTSLDCIYNQITNLDVSKAEYLESLLCNSNQITHLDVTNNLVLNWFGCNDNKLTTLNVSKNKNLRFLDCGYNQLSSLDITSNKDLSYLNCDNNKLTSLDVSMLTELTNLTCSSNQLNNLDVSKNTALEKLYCGNGQLTNLNVSKNKALTHLYCQNNQLIYLNIKNGSNSLLTDVDFTQNPNLTCIQVDDIANSNANWSTQKDVTASYDTNCTSNFVQIPDQNFEQKLIDLGIDKDGKNGMVLDSSISQIIHLDVNSSAIKDLTGISGFISLRGLKSSNNQLINLDLSKNTLLDSLDTSMNNLVTLNIKNGNNTKFYIPNLNFTGNPYLTCIQVDDEAYSNTNWTTQKDTTASYSSNCILNFVQIPDQNFEQKLIDLGIDKDGKNGMVLDSSISQITYLNVNSSAIKDLTGISGFISLRGLKLSNNQLVDLDLSKNTLLDSLDTSMNNLVTLNIKNGNNTKFYIPNLNFTDNPNLVCIQVDDVAYSNTNWATQKDAIASYNTNCTSDFALIPDQNFEQKLIDLGIDTDGLNGKISNSKLNTITYLDLSNSNISSLAGIQNFTALTYLDCDFNNLQSIDVSQNKLLTKLSLHDNKLTKLDVSANKELYNLTFSKNQISTIDLSQNTKIHSLAADRNKLSTIDLSANPEIEALYCGNVNLTTLNVSNLPNLINLNCTYTNISEIDVTANPKLEMLYFNNANLTTLNVSKNPLLTHLNVANNQLTTLDLSNNPLLKVVFIEFNPLTSLNIQNGNNKNFKVSNTSKKNTEVEVLTSFLNNTKLSCIKVDDVAYSNANWSKIKDKSATYNTECNEELALPTNNFIVETKGESCLGENNGEISISAKQTFAYTATINGKTTVFTNNLLKVIGLTPGNYPISITIPGQIFEQKFNVTIAKGATISGKSNITARKVDVEITEGTAPYTVFVDGEAQFQTTDSNFSLDLNNGGLLEVATAKACEGIFSKKIPSLDVIKSLVAHPNPTSGNFEIDIPSNKKEIKIEVYNFGGQLVSTKNYNIEDGKAYLNIENQASGIYAVKIYFDTPEYIKIIKK
ncbi:T9SS type A sorting domain-containing protein [Flavobacterium sp. EDS]|uniref:LamG-like jellyroll fold domain-containing protein n=1 Tax=Flavobacterium sp. EDS TaxID=2897328 RepID=UPI001E47AC4C|nr:LamG-like jellyroll fold domain-containing protein [Flavobacterium sp. EDS]MCD0474319.1 T9SS type A sorting domain-containing protein [Flavobacterium sp. EDS]